MSNELATQADGDLIKRIENFTARLNEEPDKEWLQKTPDGKAEYIPIGIIENQLRQDFMGLVSFGVVSERRELNEYIVVARISVFNPVIKQWLSYDGIGASQIMQDKETTIAQFTEAKKKNALEMNAPKTYAEAIKNAAKKIGKKYGADINRKFEDDYQSVYTDEIDADLMDMNLAVCETLEQVKAYWKPEYLQSKVIGQVFSKHKQRVTNKAA